MQIPNFNTNIISIGPLSIKWYSLAYILGILFCWLIIKYYNKNYKLNFYNDNNKDLFCDDFLFYSVLSIILGGRVGYVLIYDPIYFIYNPLEIFAIWKGGMSFHGALVGVMIASALICKKYNINKLLFLDTITTAVPIGLLFGRIANFINLELYGRPTNLPWGMVFPNVDNVPRHPSQLYEAIFEGFLLLIIMNLIVKIKKFKVIGLNSSIFLILYSSFRIIIELFREPDIQIGLIFKYITMGQILSIPLLIFGIYLLIKVIRR